MDLSEKTPFPKDPLFRTRVLATFLPFLLCLPHVAAWWAILMLQSPNPPTEPRNPETPKVHSKVQRMPFSTPRKKGPKSQLKCPKSPFLGPFFRGGRKRHFSYFKMHFWGFGVPGLCRGTGRLQHLWHVSRGKAWRRSTCLPYSSTWLDRDASSLSQTCCTSRGG